AVKLDNVALSFKSWASVSDSSAIGSSLSVQGSSTGVQSLAAGVRNSAYTFDGTTGYLRQQTIATNIGTLSYSGNTFIDDAQTFTSYQAANPATHMIVITNSDNTTTWGYIGSGGSATTINVYTTKTESAAGFNGTSPTGKTPVGYEVRKTDFQITGSVSVGAWVKTSSSGTILHKFNVNNLHGLGLDDQGTGGVVRFATDGNLVGVTPVNDNVWHYIVGTFNASTSLKSIYVDGKLDNSATDANTYDTPEAFVIGTRFFSGIYQQFFPGSIDEPFVTAEALTAGQIFDMYNRGRN
ncbi:MAG: LamG-like jellyroll fold domain-containing protein, partial [Candidatus Roizmanbacteria bacterium]